MSGSFRRPTCLLRPYLERTEFGRRVLQEMDEKGFMVLEGVLSSEECDAELSRKWDWVERVSPGIDRSINAKDVAGPRW